MARPKKVINKKQFESLCGIQCTKEEMCSVLGVTDKTLDKWVKENYNEYFSVVFKQKREFGLMSLRRKQMESALNGNTTMQIFLGKNLLKQSDSPVLDEIKLKELELKIKEFDLKEKLLLRDLEEATTENDVAQAIREVFGSIGKDNGDN